MRNDLDCHKIFLNTELEKLKAAFAAFEALLCEPEKKMKIGKWYKFHTFKGEAYVFYNGKDTTYGFENGKYSTDIRISFTAPMIEAKEHELTKLFTAHCDVIYKDVDLVDRTDLNIETSFQMIIGFSGCAKSHFYFPQNHFDFKNRIVFKDGKFAKPVLQQNNKVKDFVKQWMAGHKPKTFVKNEYEHVIYSAGASSLNLTLCFENLLEDFIQDVIQK